MLSSLSSIQGHPACSLSTAPAVLTPRLAILYHYVSSRLINSALMPGWFSPVAKMRRSWNCSRISVRQKWVSQVHWPTADATFSPWSRWQFAVVILLLAETWHRDAVQQVMGLCCRQLAQQQQPALLLHSSLSSSRKCAHQCRRCHHNCHRFDRSQVQGLQHLPYRRHLQDPALSCTSSFRMASTGVHPLG